mmetsp:Transcript_10348/g.23339  ORF Transcript_10348/g.23339 Transcript_10348/m.23339 type:complete len:369 (-) Transcript_10348:159-1265(-)|eukprot:CAMPEP_0178406556 /NCGR_PEP_ID=MMETSP0689_2-20121128/18973_1 /TAXON_ID=160604 /ORGANISM="Amphidinium massartii, Strain CS-259" /LENGTH=368 /DNA_ID=CAMNT_0020027601 /DNA_START=31 /DNA_END=1137 /DNA_ORIENTATION=+
MAESTSRAVRFKLKMWEWFRELWHYYLILYMPGCLLCGLFLTHIPTDVRSIRLTFYAFMAIWFVCTCWFWSTIGLTPFTWRQAAWIIGWDGFMLPGAWVIYFLEVVARRQVNNTNRLLNCQPPKYRGSRIVIIGNGPSLRKGEPLGHLIDGFDEVVRFNNCTVKGFEEYTGTKCTVHMGDAQLQMSWPEHRFEGATWILSTVMATMNTAMSMILFRIVYDLEVDATMEVINNKEVGWMPREEIKGLCRKMGMPARKMPTSGTLAIDWFVRNRPDPTVPVYIAGFDFFQGPEFHYYSNEPLWQKVVNHFGLWFGHEPLTEKAHVLELIKQGKVKWLRDLAPESSRDRSNVRGSSTVAGGEPSPKKAKTS